MTLAERAASSGAAPSVISLMSERAQVGELAALECEAERPPPPSDRSLLPRRPSTSSVGEEDLLASSVAGSAASTPPPATCSPDRVAVNVSRGRCFSVEFAAVLAVGGERADGGDPSLPRRLGAVDELSHALRRCRRRFLAACARRRALTALRRPTAPPRRPASGCREVEATEGAAASAARRAPPRADRVRLANDHSLFRATRRRSRLDGVAAQPERSAAMRARVATPLAWSPRCVTGEPLPIAFARVSVPSSPSRADEPRAAPTGARAVMTHRLERLGRRESLAANLESAKDD